MARWTLTMTLALLMGSGCAEDPLDMGAPRSCALADRNLWVADLMARVYLWRDIMPIVNDPAGYEDPAALVADLRIPGLDRWSRVADKKRTEALFKEGQYVGLGFRTRRDALGQLRIASVVPGSPAAGAGLRRGDVLEAVGDLTIPQIDAQSLWGQVYGANEPGVVVELLVRGPGGDAQPHVLIKDWIDLITVPHVSLLTGDDGSSVGYVVFESFVGQAAAELDAAFDTLRRAGVRRVVIDLRYNGGGLLDIAHRLGSLLAGRVANGALMYRAEHNESLADTDWARFFERRSESLDLERVVFITSPSTASASELLINALRPHVSIARVGSTTAGKPVGFHDWDACEQKVLPITFRMLNAADDGFYYDGLAPDCPASDDLDHERGDPREGSLAAALRAMTGAACGAPGKPPAASAAALAPPALQVTSPLRAAPPRGDGLDTELAGLW